MALEEPTPRAQLLDVLRQRGNEVVDRWVELQRQQAIYLPIAGEEELRVDGRGLVTELREGLATGLPVDLVVSDFEPLRRCLQELSMRRARQGFSPTVTASAVFGLKYACLEVLRKTGCGTGREIGGRADSETGGGTDGGMRETLISFDRLIDAAGLLTFETYVQSREEIIRRQNQQLLELSTPVVQLWDRVLALPLIGTLDSPRTQVVTENLLQAIQDYEAVVAIIDITGVPTVDTLVAQHLLQTVAATRLMGADCIISGIRPQTAQTIAQLGIDLTDIITRASLADALAVAIGLVSGGASGPGSYRGNHGNHREVVAVNGSTLSP